MQWNWFGYVSVTEHIFQCTKCLGGCCHSRVYVKFICMIQCLSELKNRFNPTFRAISTLPLTNQPQSSSLFLSSLLVVDAYDGPSKRISWQLEACLQKRSKSSTGCRQPVTSTAVKDSCGTGWKYGKNYTLGRHCAVHSSWGD